MAGERVRERFELVADAEVEEGRARDGHLQAVARDGVAQALERGGRDLGEIRAIAGLTGHGRSLKKASSGSLPMVGTRRARSRKRLYHSHEHSAM